MAVVSAACAVIVREDGAILLVQRRYPPEAGLWSVPGGKCLLGETPEDSAVRETREETGLDVVIGAELWTVELPLDDGRTYRVHDFYATVPGGVLQPGDDAASANWVLPENLAATPLVSQLLEHLRGVRLAPPPPRPPESP